MPLPPIPDDVPLPAGLRATGLHCGLKNAGEFDLGLLVADRPLAAAAVFTQNRLVGAHVPVCRDHLARSNGRVRAVLVNARNANCATGQQGIEDARRCCAELARRLDCPTEQVLMVSTGVIGAMLPTDKITDNLDELLATATPTGGAAFARAIMTTDTYPKALSRSTDDTGRITGFAKGSGMIHPDMATLLGFLTSDRGFEDPAAGAAALRRINQRTMQRVTVDGDTSPNDTLLLLHDPATPTAPATLEADLTTIGQDLARHIAADGEGATRLITVEVRGATDEDQATHVGRVIATSPLVKTAIAGRDPNWGRILSAAGRAGIPFDPERARVWVGDAEVYRTGRPLPEAEGPGSRHLQENEHITIGVDLGLADANADVWTCDLTKDYVQINADYRT